MMLHLNEAIVSVKNKPKSIGSRNTFRHMDKGTRLEMIRNNGREAFQYYFTYMEKNPTDDMYYDVHGTNIKTGQPVQICSLHMSDLDKRESKTRFGSKLKIIL